MKDQSLENLRVRIYQYGFRTEDFAELKGGLVVVEPVKPPSQSAGGVYTGPNPEDLKGTACLFFRVVATAQRHPTDTLVHAPGDVVTLRAAHLDPVNAAETLMFIKSEHLLSRWPDEHDEPAPTRPIKIIVPQTRSLELE